MGKLEPSLKFEVKELLTVLKIEVMGIIVPPLKVEEKGILVSVLKTEVKEMLVLPFDWSELNIVEALIILVLVPMLLVRELKLGLERLLIFNESGKVVFLFKVVVIGIVESIFKEEVNKIEVLFKRR